MIFKSMKKRSAGLAASVFFFLLVSAVLFSRDLAMVISHDEYQFIASAEFFRNKLLLPYINYPFLHMPYMPVINGIFLLGSRADFLTVRVFNSLCSLLSLILLFILVIRQSGRSAPLQRAVFGVTAVLLYITNPTFTEIDGRALNHAFPTLLSIAAFWLCLPGEGAVVKTIAQSPLAGLRQPAAGHFLKLLLCGLLVGIATGVRLSYAVLLAPMVFVIFLDPCFTSRKERFRGLISFGLGLFAALLPAGVLAILAPRPFFYGNFHYAVLNSIYRANLGSSDSTNLLGKLAFFFQTIFSDPATVILYLAGAGFFIAAGVRWIKTKDQSAFQLVVLFVFSAALLAGGFVPTPAWPQYFFAPLPFLILGLYWGLAIFDWKRPAPGWAISGCLCLALLFNRPAKEILPQILAMIRPARSIPSEVHRLAGEIRVQAGCPAANCKILTLAPVLPLEAGLDSYPMFAVGSFSWRTAPILPSQTRKAYHIISYDDLDEFLAGDPPAAILTGTESSYDGFTANDPGGLDQPFVDYARQNHYHPVKIAGTLNHSPLDLTLWVK